MKPTDLALNQTLGIADAPAAATHVLELPFTHLVRNHIGTVHAAAQFALAEAAAAERLRRDFGAQAGDVVPIMRSVELKYRQPATGDLLAYASVAPDDRRHLLSDLVQSGRTLVTVEVELKDRTGALTFTGKFRWFIVRKDKFPVTS